MLASLAIIECPRSRAGALDSDNHHRMDASELLECGREILDPVLLPHGFHFERGMAGPASGGEFARAAYVRGHHRLDFSVRRGLGEVVYRVRDTSLAHEDFMRAVAGAGRHAYPGFSSDPLDGFRHLRQDLEQFGKAFLRTMDEDFHEFAWQAERTRPPAGFKRLSD